MKVVCQKIDILDNLWCQLMDWDKTMDWAEFDQVKYGDLAAYPDLLENHDHRIHRWIVNNRPEFYLENINYVWLVDRIWLDDLLRTNFLALFEGQDGEYSIPAVTQFSPIHLVERLDILIWFLEHGANPNAIIKGNGQNYHVIDLSPTIEWARVLIDAGAVCQTGLCASLSHMAYVSDKTICQMLLESRKIDREQIVFDLEHQLISSKNLGVCRVLLDRVKVLPGCSAHVDLVMYAIEKGYHVENDSLLEKGRHEINKWLVVKGFWKYEKGNSVSWQFIRIPGPAWSLVARFV